MIMTTKRRKLLATGILVAAGTLGAVFPAWLMRFRDVEKATTEWRTLYKEKTVTATYTTTEHAIITHTQFVTHTHQIQPKNEDDLNHRLQPGDSLNITINPEMVIRPVNRKVLGVSFFLPGDGDAGWWENGRCRAGLPIDRSGRYMLSSHPCGNFEPLIRDLRLQMTRVYDLAMYDRWRHAGKDGNWYIAFDAKRALDLWAGLAVRLGIPQANVVIGVHLYTTQQDRETIYPRPEFWKELVDYSLSRGYRFHHWEVGNEVYLPINEEETGFILNGFSDSRDSLDVRVARFGKYFKDVSRVIRSVQGDAQIGLSIRGPDDGPWQNTWTDKILRAAAGYYDFLIGHYYNWGDGEVLDDGLERFTLTFNYAILQVQLSQAKTARSLPENYNRAIYHYDTEWGAAATRRRGDWDVYSEVRNGNTYGVLQRAVRLIYYLREGIVEGASTWVMFTRDPQKEPAFGLLTHENAELRSMVYWLYYYFQRYTGDLIIDLSGTAPYIFGDFSHHAWQGRSIPASGPVTPVIASKTNDGKQLFLIIINASTSRSHTAHIDFSSIRVKNIESHVFRDHQTDATSEGWRDNNPFSMKEKDLVRPYMDLRLNADGKTLTGTIPSRSIIFTKLIA